MRSGNWKFIDRLGSGGFSNPQTIPPVPGAATLQLYNLATEGTTRHRSPSLSNARTEQLVNYLADPDAWWRETAQRLLRERNDPAAIPRLRRLAEDRPTPLARLHALWGLGQIARKEPAATAKITVLLNDSDEQVLSQAAKLAGDLQAADVRLERAADLQL